LAAGIRSTHQLLVDVLAREGLEPIPAAGMAFDPALHEAVAGGGTGHLIVTAEMRRGYALHGRAGPSLVAVAVADLDDGDPATIRREWLEHDFYGRSASTERLGQGPQKGLSVARPAIPPGQQPG
jgi:hypothetical protein